MATYPPVDVPPIMSKYSHGLGISGRLPSFLMDSKIRSRTRSAVSPLTPPPSVMIKGQFNNQGGFEEQRATVPIDNMRSGRCCCSVDVMAGWSTITE